MKKICFILLCMVYCLCTAGEPIAKKVSLSGTITDAVDGSALVGVTVYIPALSEGTTTNEKGSYLLENLPQKRLTLQVSYLGHQTIIKEVDLRQTSTLDFVMHESNATLNEVVVTGLTGESLMKDSPTPISVVSARELQSMSSSNIIDAIAHQPGISQITTGSGISKPVIRGLGYNRIVTVNDGVRQEGQQWGDEHGIEIDAQSINNVEVLKGPASLMYGSDAMAGVVIFHGDPVLGKGQLKASASTEYQSNNGLYDYTLHAAGNQDGIVWNLRWSQKLAHAYRNKYDGRVLGSQFQEQGLNGMLGINRSWGYSHLLVSLYHLTPSMTEGERDEETGAFVKPILSDGKEVMAIATPHDLTTYGHTLPYQQIHHDKVVSDNSFYIGNGALKIILGYQQNRRQEFENVAAPTVPGLDFRLHTLNYDVHYALENAIGWKMNFGIGGMYQKSENRGEEFLIPAYVLFDAGAFATAGRQIGKWNVSGGLRFDNRHLHSFALKDLFSTISRSFRAVTGSVGVVYDVTPDMHVRLNLARGFRAPNLSELASNGVHEGTMRYELGNAGLQPEHSWQMDFGWDYSSAVVSAQLSMFANLIDNYIFSRRLGDVYTEELPTYQFAQGNARLLGGEASVDIHPISTLHFENTFSYVDSRQRHQPSSSRYLPMTPAPRWNSELQYDLIRDGKVLNNTYVKATLECNLRQNHYYSAEQTETATPSYTLVGVSAGTDILSHSRKILSVYLIADNIFDRAYQSHLSRLKYLDWNAVTGRQGVYNMGRNVCMKVVLPIL